MYVLDKIILTPDMFVLRYHKYIMVDPFPAGSCGLLRDTSPGGDPAGYLPVRSEKCRELLPSTGSSFYNISRRTYQYRPDKSEEAYDGF
jgi:hypothetical protein